MQMVVVKTTLIYNYGDSKSSENYKQIYCLNVIMKVFKSFIKSKITHQLQINDIEYKIDKNQIFYKEMCLSAKMHH
ncbi:reverse transcriptase [Entamoeba histolytica HM-3:IMSS]|uniref:Reverse transcriptase n=1 Tax=Entamoeba histolytica HM-3:IMSS TaxID=885315 RepID=M7W9X6_ENTHI|nr:reverse transcriptase [Entamoeba histolytica HM-3:IMSS]